MGKTLAKSKGNFGRRHQNRFGFPHGVKQSGAIRTLSSASDMLTIDNPVEQSRRLKMLRRWGVKFGVSRATKAD